MKLAPEISPSTASSYATGIASAVPTAANAIAPASHPRNGLVIRSPRVVKRPPPDACPNYASIMPGLCRQWFAARPVARNDYGERNIDGCRGSSPLERNPGLPVAAASQGQTGRTTEGG